MEVLDCIIMTHKNGSQKDHELDRVSKELLESSDTISDLLYALNISLKIYEIKTSLKNCLFLMLNLALNL